ncbi:bacterio-opsin activator domain-containing protein [Haloferax sp. DFSO60]|uniref:bacterio-opsin activator domain-containing protein n=1 Tax=Haloferax sp. DFSO60 TaxID=3388652 RepID=UPI0039781378
MLCVSDDDRFVRELESSLPQTLDVAVRHVRETGAAHAELLSASSAIHCVVLDMPLSAGDGLSFLRDLRERDLGLPVIVVTQSQTDASAAVEAGATDYTVRDETSAVSSWLGFRVETAIRDHQVELSYRARLEQQRVVSEIGTRALSEVNVEDVLELVTARVDEVLDANSVVILERLEDDDGFRTRASSGHSTTPKGEFVADCDESHVTATYLEGHSLIVDNFEESDVFDEDCAFASMTLRSGMCTPIAGDIRSWGVIGAYADETTQFSDDDVLFLENVATIVGAAIERYELRTALSEVLERIDEAVIAVDTDWQITYLNGTAENDFGRNALDILDHSLWDLTDDEGTFREPLETAMHTQQATSFETYSEQFDTWFAVSAYPSETGLSMYFTDITEKREREAEIKQYGRMLETVADAVYALDIEGRFTAVNPAFERLTGLQRADVLGAPASLFVDNNDPTDGGDEAFAATSKQIVEFEMTAPNGNVIRVENHRTPLIIDDVELGSVGVLRDVTERHRYERLLATLHERTRDMMRAPDRNTILIEAVEACDEVLGDARTELFVFDETKTLLRRVSEAGTGVGNKPIGAGIEHGSVWEAFVSGEVRVVEVTPDGGVVDGVERVIAAPLGRHGVLVTGHPGSIAPNDVDVELVNLLVATVEELLERVDAETELRKRDERLANKNKKLTKLNRVNATVRGVVQSLIRAPTRSDALEAVTKQLANSENYSLVWYLEPDQFEDGFRPSQDAVHGADSAYIDRLREVASTEPFSTLLTEAVTSKQMQMVDDILGDPAWGDHRGDALAYGFRSLAVLPSVADDRVEALFVIHATTPNAFVNGDSALLAELGETIGYAISTTSRAAAMLTDRKTELQIALDSDRFSIARLARRIGSDVTLTGVIPQDDNAMLAFLTTDADADSVVEAGKDIATDARVLSKNGDRQMFELRLPRESLFDTLYASDATLCKLLSNGEETMLTVEVPERVRVRTFVDAVAVDYPGTELRSRRMLTKENGSPATFQLTLREQWTDRQYEALQAAHLAGFYEWPRLSTTALLAETLGISAPTYQYHLRAAERKLVDQVFG